MVRYGCPRVNVQEGISMAFPLKACWKASKLGGSVGVEIRGMSHGCVLNKVLMLSIVDCVYILFEY